MSFNFKFTKSARAICSKLNYTSYRIKFRTWHTEGDMFTCECINIIYIDITTDKVTCSVLKFKDS